MQVLYFNKKIEKFVEEINPLFYSRVIRVIDLLKKYENKLGMPCSKALGRGLFELRTVGVSHIRLLYGFHNGSAFLLHGFIKKTNQISKRDLEYARTLLKDLQKYHG